MERNFCQWLFKVYVKESPPRMFSQSCNFLEVYVSTRSDFLVRKNSGKQQHYHKRKHNRYFNIIKIVECWRKIGCISEVSVINQSSSTQFLVATFSQMASVWFMGNLTCICDMWKGRSYVNANGSVSSIFQNGQLFLKYHFLYHRSFRLKRFSYVWIAASLFAILIYQNTKNTKVLCI